MCDVSPRDGLQNESQVLAPAVRAQLVQRLRAAGLPRIEAVSFVRDDRVPAMADPEAVIALAGALHTADPAEAPDSADPAGTPDTADLAGLILNRRGYERFVATPLVNVHVGVAMTESFGRRNANRGLAEGLDEAEALITRAHRDGKRPVAALIVAFGCPFEGAVDPGRVIEHAARLVNAGAAELSLADTVGVATRGQVASLVDGATSLGVPVGVHLHDTRNMGVLNAWTALEHGASTIDTATGGTGGCPFAPRATGNLATEDLLYLLDAEGVRTGVDLDAVIAVSRWLGEQLGRQLPARVSLAAE